MSGLSKFIEKILARSLQMIVEHSFLKLFYKASEKPLKLVPWKLIEILID